MSLKAVIRNWPRKCGVRERLHLRYSPRHGWDVSFLLTSDATPKLAFITEIRLQTMIRIDPIQSSGWSDLN